MPICRYAWCALLLAVGRIGFGAVLRAKPFILSSKSIPRHCNAAVSLSDNSLGFFVSLATCFKPLFGSVVLRPIQRIPKLHPQASKEPRKQEILNVQQEQARRRVCSFSLGPCQHSEIQDSPSPLQNLGRGGPAALLDCLALSHLCHSLALFGLPFGSFVISDRAQLVKHGLDFSFLTCPGHNCVSKFCDRLFPARFRLCTSSIGLATFSKHILRCMRSDTVPDKYVCRREEQKHRNRANHEPQPVPASASTQTAAQLGASLGRGGRKNVSQFSR